VKKDYVLNDNSRFDELSKLILEIIRTSSQPLETKEIELALKSITSEESSVSRSKIVYRLQNLRGEGLIRGKFVGPGKGVWIWYSSGPGEAAQRMQKERGKA
jgi:hypothetical protein